MEPKFTHWLMPAMEEGTADLTRETNGMMKKNVSAAGQAANGGAVDFEDGSTEPDVTSDETHAANGDNLNGPDDFSEDPDSVPGMGDEEGGEDGMGDMGGDEFGMGGDGGMGGEGEVDEMGNPILKPHDARRLRKLQENMSCLHVSVANNLKSLSEFTPSSITPEIRKVYNGALSHLTEIEKLLKEILSTKFDPATYPEKLRRYIALRHIYSVTVDQLMQIFQVIDIENGRSVDENAEKAP